MKKLSIQAKVTFWYASFMIILIVIVLTALLSISNTRIRLSIQKELKATVEQAFSEIEYEDGTLDIDDDLDFFRSGIYLSIYDQKKNLLYGKMPQAMSHHVTFSNEMVQLVRKDQTKWYVYDVEADIPGYGPLWVRGVVSQTKSEETFNNMLKNTLIGLPFLVMIIIGAGYYITKRAFRPIKKIRETVENINEGNDLSQRIGLKEGKDEVHQLGKTFDAMLTRLENAFESEKRFTADVSHELRTPTSVILSRSEYALKHIENEAETKESLEVILKQSKKMAHLISQMLTLARIEQSNQLLHVEKINLSELAQVIVEEQQGCAAEKSIKITTEIENNLMIKGDETMMMRLFINLLSNGITYGKEQGHIHLSIKKEGHQVVGRVEDNGIGIKSEHLNQIWDRFYQVDDARSSENSENAGLGLSMVKWILDAHKGSIYVESSIGEGSVFTFNLPLDE